MSRARKAVGRIAFVGAGPAEADLLTTAAAEAIARAELVIADPEVSESVRALATAEIADAGAEAAKDALTAARAGQQVVRLLVGDPMTDDAAVKEIAAVAKTVVPFAVLPALTIGLATAAYAGTPVGTVRTEADVEDAMNFDFESLAGAPGTIVVTVSAADVEVLGEQLVANGLKPDTPVAVTCNGTTSAQQTIVGTLGDIALSSVGMTGRLVVTVGRSVAQRDKLAWWESRPLYGWKVLVPRTKEQAGAMSERVRAYGAVPVRCRPSPSSPRGPRPRWSVRSRAWSPAATSGSCSPPPMR